MLCGLVSTNTVEKHAASIFMVSPTYKSTQPNNPQDHKAQLLKLDQFNSEPLSKVSSKKTNSHILSEAHNMLPNLPCEQQWV